jgi:hypothetical protein
MSQEETDVQNADVESLMSEIDDNKTYAAMGVAKTISTVGYSGSLMIPYLWIWL